jgi:hypothetical protein
MMPKRYPILRYVALAFVLGLGIQIIYAVLVGWGITVGDELIGNRGAYESVQIRADGTPVFVTHSYTDYYDMTGRTLQGDLMPREELDDWLSGAYLNEWKQPRPRFGRIDWGDRIRSFNDGGQPAGYWYFVHTGRQQGQGYFVGFDSKSKLRVGYIGRVGFRSDLPPVEDQFPVDGRRLAGSSSRSDHLVSCGSSGIYLVPRYLSAGDASGQLLPEWMVYLISGNQLWEIDLHERSIRVLAESEDFVSVATCRPARPQGTKRSDDKLLRRPQHLAIRTLDRVILLDPRTGDQQSYAIPQIVRSKKFDFYELSDQTALLSIRGRPEAGGTPIGLHWIDQQGEIVREEHVTINRGQSFVDPRRIACGLSFLVPVPAVAAVATCVALPIGYLVTGEAPHYPAALARALSEGWPALLITFALAGFMVHLCLKRQRQYALPGTRTWVVFVALFGVPALAGYLVCRRWPPRAACPACQEPVPRDRESCASCNTAFPEPAPEGIEVFA